MERRTKGGVEALSSRNECRNGLKVHANAVNQSDKYANIRRSREQATSFILSWPNNFQKRLWAELLVHWKSEKWGAS